MVFGASPSVITVLPPRSFSSEARASNVTDRPHIWAETEAERADVGLGNVINRFLEVRREGEQVRCSDEELR